MLPALLMAVVSTVNTQEQTYPGLDGGSWVVVSEHVETQALHTGPSEVHRVHRVERGVRREVAAFTGGESFEVDWRSSKTFTFRADSKGELEVEEVRERRQDEPVPVVMVKAGLPHAAYTSVTTTVVHHWTGQAFVAGPEETVEAHILIEKDGARWTIRHEDAASPSPQAEHSFFVVSRVGVEVGRFEASSSFQSNPTMSTSRDWRFFLAADGTVRAEQTTSTMRKVGTKQTTKKEVALYRFDGKAFAPTKD